MLSSNMAVTELGFSSSSLPRRNHFQSKSLCKFCSLQKLWAFLGVSAARSIISSWCWLFPNAYLTMIRFVGWFLFLPPGAKGKQNNVGSELEGGHSLCTESMGL